jgi:D-alanyl-D-alanine dipeptidase
MKVLPLLFLFSSIFVWAAESPQDADLVELKKLDFTIRLDMRYATDNNFTKHTVYPFAKCFLRKPVAEALARVESALRIQDLSLKVFDCYRPLSVQKTFWNLVPDERYVADPKKGSRHNRGAAVDLTLVEARSGKDVEMPSEFDDFSEKAHRNYKKMSKVARRNMKTLEKAMVKEGFIPFDTEWWHFDYQGWEKYDLLDVPFSAFPKD